MKMTIPTKQYGRQAALFGLAAAGFYLLMIFVTLAHIESLSGLRPFDMRPGGYSAELANSLISDLVGPKQRQYAGERVLLGECRFRGAINHLDFIT